MKGSIWVFVLTVDTCVPGVCFLCTEITEVLSFHDNIIQPPFLSFILLVHPGSPPIPPPIC